MNIPTTVTTRSERLDVGNADIALQTEPVREDQEVQAILVDNLKQNEENVDIIPPASIRSAHLSLHVDDNSVTRSSQVRTHDIAGISSIRPVDRSIGSGIGQIQPRTSTINRRDSSDGRDIDEYHRRRGRPPQRGGPPDRGRPQIEEDCLVEEDPLMIEEDPLIEEDPQMMEDPLMMIEDPLAMEDHPMEMEDPQGIPIEEEPQDQEDLPDQ